MGWANGGLGSEQVVYKGLATYIASLEFYRFSIDEAITETQAANNQSHKVLLMAMGLLRFWGLLIGRAIEYAIDSKGVGKYFQAQVFLHFQVGFFIPRYRRYGGRGNPFKTPIINKKVAPGSSINKRNFKTNKPLFYSPHLVTFTQDQDFDLFSLF